MLKLATFIVLVLGLSLVATAQTSAPANVPPLGKLVDVGGWRLHVNLTGENHADGPAVILEDGGGGFSFNWYLVQSKVADFARVCSYDRAGDAWSDVGPRPRTMKQIAYELRTALANAGIKGPYVLVGQSIGGLYVRVFAEEYPQDVAGLVLVDPTNEDTVLGMGGRMQRVRLTSKERPIPPVQKTITDADRKLTAEYLIEAEKFVKARVRPRNNPPFDRFPAGIQRARLWALAQPAHYMDDYEDYMGEDFAGIFARRQAQNFPLGEKPLIVLLAGKYEVPMPPPPGQTAEQWNQQLKERGEDHLRHRREMEQLSRNGKVTVNPNGSHSMHLDDPDSVVDAIRRVIDAAKNGTKL